MTIWKDKECERIKLEAEKRERYLAMPESESFLLPAIERYEWIKFHREKEATQQVLEKQRAVRLLDDKPDSKRFSRFSRFSKVIYNQD